MNYLASSWLLLPSLLALAASERTTSAQPPRRDPFRTPQQEQASDPGLFAHRTSPRSAQQLRLWRLQGVLGNPNRGLWGLVRTPKGEWHCLRVGELILGYRVVDIDTQRVLLQRFLPSAATTTPPLILPWVGNETAELAAEQR